MIFNKDKELLNKKFYSSLDLKNTELKLDLGPLVYYPVIIFNTYFSIEVVRIKVFFFKKSVFKIIVRDLSKSHIDHFTGCSFYERIDESLVNKDQLLIELQKYINYNYRIFVKLKAFK